MPSRLAASWILFFYISASVSAADFADIEVHALTRYKAILQIDGKRRVLTTGQTSPEGVLLIEASGESAIVEVDGVRKTLGVTTVTAPLIGENNQPREQRVTLYAGSQGFFSRRRQSELQVRAFSDRYRCQRRDAQQPTGRLARH